MSAPERPPTFDIGRLRPQLLELGERLQLDGKLVQYAYAISHFAVLEVPRCVAVVLTLVVHERPHLVWVTSVELSLLDAVRYLEGTSAEGDPPPDDRPEPTTDPLEQEHWHRIAHAAATGIRSSLSLPLRYDGRFLGTLSLYGDTRDAFDDRSLLLAELISGHAGRGSRDVDLSFSAARLGVRPPTPVPEPAQLLDNASVAHVERAVTMVMRRRRLDHDDARDLLAMAAAHADLSVLDLAERLVIA